MRALRGLCLAFCMSALFGVAQAQADFGFLPGAEGFDAALTKQDGFPATNAGSHPYEMRVEVGLNQSGGFADGDLRDLEISLPQGLIANPASAPRCAQADFHTPRVSPFQTSLSGESCPDPTQVGVIGVHSSFAGGTRYFGLFNLAAPLGSPGAIGFAPFGAPVVLAMGVGGKDATLSLGLQNLPQFLSISGLEITLWGTPLGSPSQGPGASLIFEHDSERGNCLNEEDPAAHFGTPGTYNGSEYKAGTCSVGPDPVKDTPDSYLTLPTSCDQPLEWRVTASSWQDPDPVEASALGKDTEGHPLSLQGCVEFRSAAKVQLQTDNAASATGLVFNIDINDGGGLLNEAGKITSPIQEATVTLPEGLTINPSVGAGLGVCSPAEFAREQVDTLPGAGCPNASKLGEVSIEGLLGLPDPVGGSVYLAKPYENPFNSLVALYITAADASRGLFAKSAGKLVPDPHTGRLIATFKDLPLLHYTHFSLALRQGQRALMVSPPACGTYSAALDLVPYSDPATHLHDASTLFINHGEAGGPCPTGALRPFTPKLEAGSANPQAASYTPFYLHMTRTDAEQEITSYSATFPAGLLGKLAGIPYCPEATIAAAKAKSGTAELAAPSCPAASQIGRTLAGYGVGGVLAYAPGRLYLAGPYHGAPFSTVAVNSALVGPFDLGVVTVRSAIRVNPKSAQASIDSQGSDPIPHILEGIPIHLRDIRVYVDRPSFTLNPTSCDPLRTLSVLSGSGLDPFSAADDTAATSADHFQALGCPSLGFAPKLTFNRKGDTRRGRYPSLRATYTPKPGDANLRAAAVTLPPSLFLAQEHINTVCTRPQFAAHACPPGSIYGHATAITPLLDEPFEGPVYLRSSDHTVPDIVADLRGRGFEIEVAGRIDSDRKAIRATFTDLPDAPVTKFTLKLNGGKKGILVNSGRVCAEAQLAVARFTGQNAATEVIRPKVRARCGGHHK